MLQRLVSYRLVLKLFGARKIFLLSLLFVYVIVQELGTFSKRWTDLGILWIGIWLKEVL